MAIILGVAARKTKLIAGNLCGSSLGHLLKFVDILAGMLSTYDFASLYNCSTIQRVY
jgi:hypothetical protein